MMVFYLHVLRTRGFLARNRFLVVATITLFILCSIHCFFLLAMAIAETRDGILIATGEASESGRSDMNLNIAANAVYVTSKCVSLSSDFGS